jgi:hypothetical protein
MDSPRGACAEPWLAMWEVAAVWSRASMEAMARMWGLPSSRKESLPTLALAMERQMRTEGFIRLMGCGLRVTSARSWVDLANAFLDVSGLLVQRRVLP